MTFFTLTTTTTTTTKSTKKRSSRQYNVLNLLLHFALIVMQLLYCYRTVKNSKNEVEGSATPIKYIRVYTLAFKFCTAGQHFFIKFSTVFSCVYLWICSLLVHAKHLRICQLHRQRGCKNAMHHNNNKKQYYLVIIH